MKFAGRNSILYWSAVVLLLLLMAAILILLIVNLVLWASLFQANVLLVLSNVFYGVGMLLPLLLILLLMFGTSTSFSDFSKDHRIILVALTVYSLILTALMIPVWIFIIMYWANDFETLTTSRLGSVTSDAVTVFVRAPAFSQVGLIISPVAAISKRSILSRKRQVDLLTEVQFGPTSTSLSVGTLVVPQSTDSTVSFRVSNLLPSTTYTIIPVLATGLIAQRELESISVTTFPVASEATQYTFAFGSCIHKAMRGFARLSDLSPDFFLFLGDFIYIENPIDQGRDVKYYNKRYRRHLDDRNVQTFLSATPSFFMFDDHEIFNDFPGTEFDSREYRNGILTAWTNYLGNTNPAPRQPGSLYYNFTRGNTAFFVIDTRSFRDRDDGIMLGATQTAHLQQWLLDTNTGFPFRFIASSISWSASNGDDSWTAFRKERNELFNFLIVNGINGVVLLSGDLHYALVTELVPGLFEFSASPIDAFPFFSVGDVDGRKLFDRKGHRNIGIFSVDTVNLVLEGQIFDLTFGAPPKYRLRLTPPQLVIRSPLLPT